MRLCESDIRSPHCVAERIILGGRIYRVSLRDGRIGTVTVLPILCELYVQRAEMGQICWVG
jgi:hypothetical protein